MDAIFKLHFRALSFVLLALLCGCAGFGNSAGAVGQNPAIALPQLPAGMFDRHRVAQVQTSHLTGDDVALYSPAAVAIGSTLQLAAAAGQPALEWGIWRLPVSAGAVPQSATFSLS